jgi:heparan-alpha-glucosaminide N-acetyltransferase
MNSFPRRLASVDAFRAITMFMMIFVNDLWSLKNIPDWLEHAAMKEDRLGLADTVFPAFLFIVGLSIPFAIKARQAKGASRNSTLVHIFMRSFALLVMGIFHVNLENYNKAEALLPKPIWQIAITVAFFLIWLDYSPALTARKKMILRGSGVVLLAAMALLYKGGMPGHTTWMRPHWYGILGLIGWSYLLCACIYLFSKDKLAVLAAALIFFLGFNIGVNAGWLDFIEPMKHYVWIVGDGSLPALTMAGVLVSVLYRQLSEKGKGRQCMLALGIFGLVMMAAGFALRPCWGISKIRATPSWVLICMGISVGCFLLLIFVMDIRGKQDWMKWLKPAGTSTLTCYLLPYIHYAIYNLLGVGFALPLALRTGGVGIIKCLLYAFVIIQITGLLERRRIRLSI